MDQFLDNLSSEGESLEDDAEFTLDPLKQAERYATFQQENSVYCLLRIFQGLTLAGAQAVDIKVEKKRIEMQATSPKLDLQPETISDALYRTRREPYLGHICVGVFSATDASVGRLEIALGKSLLRVQDETFSVVDSPREVRHLTISLEYSKRGWLESGAKEQLELANRLHHAPMPVTIDTRRLSMNAPPPQDERWYKEISRVQMLARLLEELPEESGLTPLTDDLFLSESKSGSRSFVLLDSGGALFIDLALEGGQILIPIIDGVAGSVIETVHLPGLQGCQRIVDPKTDLSGLALTDAEPFVQKVEARYWSALETLLPHVSHLRAVWPRNFDLSDTVGKVACTGELALIAVPLTLVIGGTYQAFDQLSFRLQKKKQQEALVLEAEDRIRSLLEARHSKLRGSDPS
jgi:hypothetical protein